MSVPAPFPPRHLTASGARTMPVRSTATPAVGRTSRPVRALTVVREPTPVQAPTRLRLTRRGHIVLLAASCLVMFGVILGSGAVADAAVSLVDEPATALIVVQPGDSLWSIAQRVAGEEDPRGVVDPDLCVRGVQGLRVADASIMPSDCRANLHFTCVMIGEMAARRMRAAPPPA